MALEDFMEPEVAVTAAVAAAVFSPRARKVIRKGLVYGMAGVLVAGDALASLAHGVGQGVQQAGAAAATAAQNTANQAQARTNGAASPTETTTTGTGAATRKPAPKSPTEKTSQGNEKG
jgi:hypothetical protein